MPASPYNPANWYWVVGGHTSFVFSSAVPGFVSVSNGTYVVWLAAGNNPTTVPNDGTLVTVLVNADLFAAALAAAPSTWTGVTAILQAQSAIQSGCALTSTGTPAVDATYETTGLDFQIMLAELAYVQANSAFSSGGTLAWPARSGTVTFSSTTTFTAVVSGLIKYVVSWRLWVAAGGGAPTFGAITIA